MGTNFYARVLEDGRELHLGKRSAGWQFHFHAQPEFGSFRELAGFLETRPVELFDEYGKSWDLMVWVEMARSWWMNPADPGHRSGARSLGCPRCGPVLDPTFHGDLSCGFAARWDALHTLDEDGLVWSPGEWS